MVTCEGKALSTFAWTEIGRQNRIGFREEYKGGTDDIDGEWTRNENVKD